MSMRDKIKSGKEILDEYFSTIDKIPGVDNEIAKTFLDLYRTGKFTNTNISNALATLRENNDTSEN
jgi:hypothetical protein